MRRTRLVATLLVGALGLVACSGDGPGTEAPPSGTASPEAPAPDGTPTEATATDVFHSTTTVAGVRLDLLGQDKVLDDRPVAVLLHGAAFDRTSMRNFGAAVAAAGFAVAVPDWGGVGSGALCAAVAASVAAQEAGATSTTVLFGMSIGASTIARELFGDPSTLDSCEVQPDWTIRAVALDGGSYSQVIAGMDEAPAFAVLPIAGGNEEADVENADELAHALTDLGVPTSTLVLEDADHCHPACRAGATTWPVIADALRRLLGDAP